LKPLHILLCLLFWALPSKAQETRLGPVDTADVCASASIYDEEQICDRRGEEGEAWKGYSALLLDQRFSLWEHYRAYAKPHGEDLEGFIWRNAKLWALADSGRLEAEEPYYIWVPNAAIKPKG